MFNASLKVQSSIPNVQSEPKYLGWIIYSLNADTGCTIVTGSGW